LRKNGSGFLDEASLQGENHVVILKDNEIVEMSIDPETSFCNTCATGSNISRL
jgi:anthranilate phosphoribosyltransferase